VWFAERVLTLTGTHVRLVPLAVGHVDALVAAATEPGARFEWTTVPTDPVAMDRFIRWQLDRRDEGTWIPFATLGATAPDGTAAVIGSTSFLDVQRWDGDDPRTVEIGATWLAPSAQRTAANTEAKLLMLTHAFESWGVVRVQLKTDARNTPSRAAIERLGARPEGILRNLQPGAGVLGAGGPRDTAMYSIVPDEWPSVRDRLTARLARA
jgi:RimJ/RimL family protein N-acetyltransferase